MSEIFGNEQTIQNLDKASNTLDSLQTKLMVTQYSTAALDVVTKKFTTGSLNNITTSFGKFTTNLDKFNKSGNKVDTLLKTMSKSGDVLNKSVEKTDTLLAKTSKTAANFGKVLEGLTTGVFAVKGANIIADGFGKINNEVKQLNASLAILNKSGIDTSNLVALQAFSDAVTNLDAKNVEEFSTTFVSMYKRTTTLMSQIATQTSEQIDKYNKDVKNSVDKGRTYLEKYFDDMQDMVNNKLKNTVTSTDALRASYTGLQAGLKPGVELTDAVANSLKLMTTQGGDADQIMTLLVQTMTAYNMSASQSGKIMAQLNELVNVGITDVPQLQNGFGQLAVGAASTNVKLEEMSGGLATLTLNGYSTARSMTAMQNLFNQISSGDITQRLIANGSKYIENGKLVQATLDSNTIASKGFAKALEDVNKSMGGNKAKWQEIIPDMEAYGAAIALTGEKAKTLTDSIKRIADVSAASLEKAFNIKIDEDKVLNFSRLVNRTSELMIKLGKLLAPVFEEGLTNLEKLTNYSEVMVKNYGGVISVIVKLTLSLKVLTSTVGIFASKVLQLGGLLIAWRVSTGAILGDLNVLRKAIFNTGDALAGYNVLWDKNASGMRKVSAVIGQLVGLHSLEAKSITGLSVLEGKRLSQDIKDSALRMRNDAKEISALDAKIARYETLKRINAENYNSTNESVFARGEIAKGKRNRLNELGKTKNLDLLTLNDVNATQEARMLAQDRLNERRALIKENRAIRDSIAMQKRFERGEGLAESALDEYQMGKAGHGTLSQREIYEGERAIGIKDRAEKGENKYFFEPFKKLDGGLDLGVKKVNGAIPIFGKFFNILNSIAKVGLGGVAAFGVGLLAVVNNLDSYTSKIKDVGANLSQPVTLMSTWERIGKNVLANLKEITKEGTIINKTFSGFGNFLKPLIDPIANSFSWLKEGMDAAKMEAQQPLVDSINSVIDSNQIYRNKTLQPNLNQYTNGQFQLQNISADPKKSKIISINDLVKKAMSGAKFEFDDSQNFGEAVAKMNATAFKTKTDTTEKLNALTKDKEGLATLIGDDKITNYLDKLTNNQKVTKEERILVEGLISKLEPAQRELIPTFQRSSKEVQLYTEKLNLLTKQSKLWSDALSSVSGYLGNLAKSGGDLFSSGTGLKAIIKETESKIKTTTTDFRAFMERLGDNTDLTKLDDKQLQKVKNFKSDIDAATAQMLQTSQLLIGSGYSTASKEAERLQQQLKDNLKLGAIDPLALNEYLKTLNALKQQAFEDDVNRVQKEKSLYENMYDERYKEYYEYTKKIRELDIRTAQLQIDKTKSALEIAKQDKAKDPATLKNLERDVELARANKLKLERTQFDQVLNESLKRTETKYQSHYFKLLNLQLEGVDKSREISENEFKKNQEMLNQQLDSLLEIQKKNNTPEIQKQIEETKYKLVQNYATKVIAEYDRVAKSQLLAQTKVQNALSLQNPLMQNGVDLLDKQLGILEKQKSVLDQQTNNRISNLEQLKGFLKTYAGQREVEKQILEQKEIALQRQIESEGMTLKIQKQQRDLKLEMLKIDQKMQESDAEYQAREANLQAKKASVDFKSGKISQDDLSLAQENASNKTERVRSIYQRRALLEAQKYENDYQDQLDAYQSAQDIRNKRNDIKRGYAQTTMSTRDDLEVGRDIVNQDKYNPLRLPNYNGKFNANNFNGDNARFEQFKNSLNSTPFSQQGLTGLTSTADKQLNVLERIYSVLSGDKDSNLPHYADGAIVKRRTKAIIGEAGTEAVIPMPNGKSIPVEIRGGGGNGSAGGGEMWNGYKVKSINTKSGIQKVLDTTDTKAIEAFKRERVKYDTEFNGKSLSEIEDYWIKRGFMTEADRNNPNFISSKNNRASKIKTPVKSKPTQNRNWLDKILFPDANAGNMSENGSTLRDKETLNPFSNKTQAETKLTNKIDQLYNDRQKQKQTSQTKLLTRNDYAYKFVDGILKQQGLSDTTDDAKEILNRLISGTAQKGINGVKIGKDIISQQRFEDFIKTGKYGTLNQNQLPIEKNNIAKSNITALEKNTKAIEANTYKIGNNSKPVKAWNNQVSKMFDPTLEQQPTYTKTQGNDRSLWAGGGYWVRDPNAQEQPIERPDSSWTIEQYYRWQKTQREKDPYTTMTFADPERLGITKSENPQPNPYVMYNKSSGSMLSQLQNNPLNKQFLNRVVENIKAGKGGSMSMGELSEYDNFAFDIAEKQLNSKSSIKDAVEKNRVGMNNSPSLSQRNNATTNNSKSNVIQVGDIIINMNGDKIKDAKSTGQTVGQEVRNVLYDVFNEVNSRLR